MKNYSFHIVCRKYPEIEYDRVVQARCFSHASHIIRRQYDCQRRWELTRLNLLEVPGRS